MPEEITQGKSLEEIRQAWAAKLTLPPEKIVLEVIEKPGFFTRTWKVRVKWEEPAAADPEEELAAASALQEILNVDDVAKTCESRVRTENDTYIITVGEGVEMVIPYSEGGETRRGGVVQQAPFSVTAGEEIEFKPHNDPGCRKWTLDIKMQGLSVGAKIENRRGIKYVLPDKILSDSRLMFSKYVKRTETAPWGEAWDEARLHSDLQSLGVVHGVLPDLWDSILLVHGYKEMIAAQATMPVPPVPPKLENFVLGEVKREEEKTGRVDFFASKIQLVQEGAVLARKTPAVPGIPGKNVLGKEIPTSNFKDFRLKGRKNVRLSEDGNELIAAVGGHPVRVDTYTYTVENVYAQDRDVDMETGSIDFSGDVVVNGSVQDSFHIVAGGKVEINGSISHAEVRAENGLRVSNNVLGGKVVVGEKFVVRSEMVRGLTELSAQLHLCLQQTAAVLPAAGKSHIKPGQCLKLVIERQFPELPKQAVETVKFLDNHKEDLAGDELMAVVRTAKQFLYGLGPLEAQALPALTKADQDLARFVDSMAVDLPEKLNCDIGYAQGAEIQCGGDFYCQKGIYNSVISAEGNITIDGVCRGGKLYSGGDVTIRELGGAGVSKTLVQMKGEKRLKADYCHPNVTIVVGKEIVSIEEPAKNLEVYRENGFVQVDKLRG